MSPAHKDRRLAPRRGARSTVRVECRQGPLWQPHHVRFLDIAEGGIRLLMTRPIETGAEVEVVLVGHGMAAPLERLASACWSLPLSGGQYAVGLRFHERLRSGEIKLLAVPELPRVEAAQI